MGNRCVAHEGRCHQLQVIGATQTLQLDPGVSVLVGMNEAGKTVMLKALEKSSDVRGDEEFDPVEDYPPKELNAYLKKHTTNAGVRA